MPAPARRRSPLTVAFCVLLWAAAVPALLLAAAPATPPARWLSTRLFVAQAVAFPQVAGAALCMLAALVAVPLFRRRTATARVGLAALAGWLTAGVLLMTCPSGPPWTPHPTANTRTQGRALRIATLNSLDTLTHDGLTALTTRFDPDVVVLPEAGPLTVRDAVAGTPFAGHSHTATEDFTPGYRGEIAPTSVLIHPRLGEVARERGPATTFGAVTLRPAAPGLPRIVAVHTAPPVPGWMTAWRDDIARVLAYGEDPTHGPVIVAGDFNATLRHGPLAARTRLVDTAQACPQGVRGTWPADRTGWLQTPIDHVFVGEDTAVVSCATLRVGAADHLAYATTLRLPG